jgi:two-component system, OmpR family, response regulator VicR
MVTAESIKQNRALIVRNDPGRLDLLARSLESGGYNTIIAADEDEAMDLLEKTTPDIVILDTVTSDAHSLHILDSLKNKSNAPVIIVTGDNEIDTLQLMFEHGADDLIYKPFATLTFLARLHAKLRRYQKSPGLMIPHAAG